MLTMKHVKSVMIRVIFVFCSLGFDQEEHTQSKKTRGKMTLNQQGLVFVRGENMAVVIDLKTVASPYLRQPE